MGKAADALGRTGAKLRTLPYEGVTHATSKMRREILAQASTDSGGDRRLSGVRNGKALTVKVTKRELGNLVEGRVMAGPRESRAQWFWMEEGTAAGFRRVRPGSRRHTGTLTTFGHPGTPAKQTWSKPVGRAAPSVEKHFEDLFKRAMTGR